jgi:amino acid transporter
MTTDEKLIRAIGVRGLASTMMNYTVGAGIFVLPALAAAQVGAAAPLVYLICAVAIGLILLCFADAGSRISLSGGTYGYAQVAFGPYVGFMVAACLWFGSSVLASAAVANVFMDALGHLVPTTSGATARGLILAIMYSFFALINIRGVKMGSGMVQTVTVAKLTPLFILVAVGLFAINPQHLAWPGMPPLSAIARASIVLIFAFLGTETALSVSGEVTNPARTVPRAIFITIVLVTLLYMGIQIVSQGVLGPDLALNQKTPLAETARRVLGSGGQTLILVGTAISTFGYVGGDMLAAPRGLYALGKDKLLPSFIGAVNEKYRTPHVAIIIHAVLCAAFAISGSFAGLIVLATLATLIVYLVCCAAVIKLQRMNLTIEGTKPFRLPGGPVIPIIACAIVIWLMTASTRQEFVAMAIMLAVQTGIFLLMKTRLFSPLVASEP